MSRRTTAIGVLVVLTGAIAGGVAAASGGSVRQDAGPKARAIRYDLEHAHRADRSLLAAFAVFAVTSPTGVKTAAGNVISRPPISSLPLDIVQGGEWLHVPVQLDPSQVREVITPSGVHLYVIPGRRGLCLLSDGGGGSCDLLPYVEAHGIFMTLGSSGVTRSYRILPKTVRSITVHTRGGPSKVRVPDGIYVSPKQRNPSNSGNSSSTPLMPICRVPNVQQAVASLPKNPTPEQITALCQKFGRQK